MGDRAEEGSLECLALAESLHVRVLFNEPLALHGQGNQPCCRFQGLLRRFRPTGHQRWSSRLHARYSVSIAPQSTTCAAFILHLRVLPSGPLCGQQPPLAPLRGVVQHVGTKKYSPTICTVARRGKGKTHPPVRAAFSKAMTPVTFGLPERIFSALRLTPETSTPSCSTRGPGA